MIATLNDLTADYVRSILDYDAQTGVFRWRWRDDIPANWNARFAVAVAGCLNDNGYRKIGINKRIYQAHRLAWLIVTGAWPSDQLDHINGDRADNRLVNLRECSGAENDQNRAKRKHTTSGFIGVNFHKAKQKWRAYITADRKQRHLGLFATRDEAASAYLAAKQRLHEFQPVPRKGTIS